MRKEYAWKDSHVEFKSKPDVNKPLYTHADNRLVDSTHSPKNIESMNNYQHFMLQPEHIEAIHSYKSNSHLYNKPLRNKSNLGEKEQNYKRLNHVTSHIMLEPHTSFRGIRMGYLPIGTHFTDLGFTGTSINPYVAKSFGHGGIFAIHAPAGTKSYYIDKFGHTMKHEQEHLYHPETSFVVVGHTKHPEGFGKSTYVTHLAVTGQGLQHSGSPDYSLSEQEGYKPWLEHVYQNLGGLISRKPYDRLSKFKWID